MTPMTPMTRPDLGAADAARVWRAPGARSVAATNCGPLAGVGVAVKDLIAVRGQRVGAGVPTYLEQSRPARRDAPCLARLVEAGAHVEGIAHTDEFAYSILGVNPHYGAPPNAADPERVPGGSSSGPASAVGLGLADLGLATDTAGSIRVPASYQGLWGLRTTWAAVPRAGVTPLAPSFDTVGWLARSPEIILAAACATIRRRSPGPAQWSGSDQWSGSAQWSGPAQWRQLLVLADLVELADPAVRQAFADWIDQTGFEVLPLSNAQAGLPSPEEMAESFRRVQAAEAWRSHGEWIRQHPGALGQEVASRFAAAAAIRPDQEDEARRQLAPITATVRGLVAGRLLAIPSTPGPGPRLDQDPVEFERVRRATFPLTCLAAIAGLPAMSVPALRVDGLPVGVSLLAQRGADRALAHLACQRLHDPDRPTTPDPRRQPAGRTHPMIPGANRQEGPKP